MGELNNKAEHEGQRLQDLLGSPREGLNTEYKGWLDLSSGDDKANLAKATLAIANFGGGFVVLGFDEESGDWIASKKRPTNLVGYDQDRVNGIVHRYADPPFHCEVHNITHPVDGDLHPVIIVPGGHRVPIRAKRDGPNKRHIRQNAYYIRRPGPISEEPRSAREWDDLIGRCLRNAKEDLLESIGAFLGGAGPAAELESSELDDWFDASVERWKEIVASDLSETDPDRFEHGAWSVAYIVGSESGADDASDMLALLSDIKGHETGWPVWWIPTRQEIRPYPYEGLIECWLGKGTRFADPAHSDFWRASPEGKLFLARGYQEDSHPDRIQPGIVFDLVIPAWRAGEVLLHAERLAARIADDTAPIAFRFRWDGLEKRVLQSWSEPMRHLSYDRKNRQKNITSDFVFTGSEISADLASAIKKVTKALYEAFDFFEPPLSMFEDVVAKMKPRGG